MPMPMRVLDSPRFGVQKQICPALSGLGRLRGIVLPWAFSPGWYVAPLSGLKMENPCLDERSCSCPCPCSCACSCSCACACWIRRDSAFKNKYVPPLQGWGDGVALSFPGPSAQAGMLRPFRAGDGAFEKGLKGSDIPARAEGLGKIPAKRNISPEGAEHKLTFHEEVGFALFCRCIRVVLWRRTEK